MESRKRQLEFLSGRINEANEKINSVIERLGWNREIIKQKPSLSKISKKKKKNIVKSSLFFYQELPSVVSFTVQTPETSHKNIINTDLLKMDREEKTVEQRLEIYNQIIRVSKELKR
ncbi:unnamed protein product [Rhizopus stolonifer]